MQKIFIYQTKNGVALDSINSIDEASQNDFMCTSRTILNEDDTHVELIGLWPLFIHRDEAGRAYASLPDRPVIHGQRMAKSAMKFLGTNPVTHRKTYAISFDTFFA